MVIIAGFKVCLNAYIKNIQASTSVLYQQTLMISGCNESALMSHGSICFLRQAFGLSNCPFWRAAKPRSTYEEVVSLEFISKEQKLRPVYFWYNAPIPFIFHLDIYILLRYCVQPSSSQDPSFYVYVL